MVDVGGEKVEVRGLSRWEAIELRELASQKGLADAEVFAIARACGVSDEDANAWMNAVSPDVADVIMTAIMELSGLGTGGGTFRGDGSRPAAGND
jgi:hypothetical protein